MITFLHDWTAAELCAQIRLVERDFSLIADDTYLWSAIEQLKLKFLPVKKTSAQRPFVTALLEDDLDSRDDAAEPISPVLSGVKRKSKIAKQIKEYSKVSYISYSHTENNEYNFIKPGN